jgi:phosphate transport system protein
MMPYLEEKLQQDIDRIRDKVREMADLALRGLEDSIKTLITGDTKLGYAAILRDSRIDDLESLIDGLCVEFIVRHIPVAAHLRFVHSVAKICSELERVGDYAESINRLSILLGSSRPAFDFSMFERLAGVAIDMIRQAIRSFLDEDLDLAIETTQLDARADLLHYEIYEALRAQIPTDSNGLERLFTLLSIANRYERVADQACNICDEVQYIATGEVTKHRLHTDLQILFVSSASSCHSLMAQRIGRAIAGDHFDFFSADIAPSPLDPLAEEFLAKKGIPTSASVPTTLAEIGDLSRFKAVVAIGDEAAKALPEVGYKTVVLEWHIVDPTRPGSGETPEQVYARAFDELLEHVRRLIRSLHGTVVGQITGESE